MRYKELGIYLNLRNGIVSNLSFSIRLTEDAGGSHFFPHHELFAEKWRDFLLAIDAHEIRFFPSPLALAKRET